MTISRLNSNQVSPVATWTPDFSNTATGSGSGYKYVSFTTSGTLNVISEGLFDVLVVAGGGGGGNSGGGGAGAMVYKTGIYLPVGNYTVVVGAGGSAQVSGNVSSVGPVVAAGGGYGGVANDKWGGDGGSGGGGSKSTFARFRGGYPVQGTAYGNYGSYGTQDGGNNGGGGGGGGAGGPATDGPNNLYGGVNGPAASNSITGSAVLYAGGACGTGLGNPSPVTGGTAYNAAGPANTGNGGGGAGNAGGSGIVIVRVAV